MAIELPDYIYIAQCNEFYKIGISKNPAQRLRELQTGNPYDIRIVATVEIHSNVVAVEKYLHRRFYEYRQRNEWFQLPQEAIDWVVENGHDLPRIARKGNRYWEFKNDLHKRLGVADPR